MITTKTFGAVEHEAHTSLRNRPMLLIATLIDSYVIKKERRRRDLESQVQHICAGTGCDC